ncbi:dienelactone hydrolase family protein, partial [Cupriavidus sp. L7L]
MPRMPAFRPHPASASRAARRAAAVMALGLVAWSGGAAAHAPDLPPPALVQPPLLSPAGALAPGTVTRQGAGPATAAT